MWDKVWDILFDHYNLCLKADTYGDSLADAPSASRFLGKFHGYFGFSMMQPSLERARNAPI